MGERGGGTPVGRKPRGTHQKLRANGGPRAEEALAVGASAPPATVTDRSRVRRLHNDWRSRPPRASVPHGARVAAATAAGTLCQLGAGGSAAPAASVTQVVPRGQKTVSVLRWRAAPRARLVQPVDAAKQSLGVRRRGWGYYSQAPGLLMTPPKRPRWLGRGRRIGPAVEPRTWTSCNQGPLTVQACRRCLRCSRGARWSARVCPRRREPRLDRQSGAGTPNRQTDRPAAARNCLHWLEDR